MEDGTSSHDAERGLKPAGLPAGSEFRSLLSEFSREYASVVVGVGLSRLITFGVSAILARELAIGDFGAYSVAYTVAVLIGQLPGVWDSGFVRHYAQSTGTERASFLRAHVLIKSGVLAAMALLGLALYRVLAVHLFGKTGLDKLLLAAILAGAFYSMITTALSYFQARKRFVSYAALLVFSNLVGLIAILVYVSAGRPTALGSMLVFNTVVYAAVAVGVVVWLGRKRGGEMATSSALRRLLRFSGWLIPATLCYAVLQRVDFLFLARYADYETLGFYGAAVTVSSVISLFTSNLTVIFLPKAALAIQSREGLRQFLLQMGLALLGIAILAGVGMVWSEPLLRFALGNQYAQAAGPLRLLLVSYVLTAVSGPLATILYAEGRTDLAFGERVVELVAVLVAGYILIPMHGANGAAAAIATSYLLGAVFVTVAVGRSVRVAFRRTSQ